MGTEVATQADMPFAQIERMAMAVAKSGMFAVKTQEGALTLMLLAQAEGIHPAQAMMDYDIIPPNGGRPCMKSGAMLARFQKSGGKVRWITSTDDVAEAEFSHPAGGSLTVKWDHDRLKKAGLGDKDMHKKYPAQMKRARCISEGVKAVAPQCIPAGMYTPEEVQDMPPPEEQVVNRVDLAMQTAANIHTALTKEERAEHLYAINSADTPEALRATFASAWQHAKAAKDQEAGKEFQSAYDAGKALMPEVAP